MIDLVDELRQVVERLNAGGIEYALCGGLAMAVYAMPRATLDIDLMIEAEALEKVRQAVGELGFTIGGLPMIFKGGQVRIERLSKLDLETRMPLVLDLMLVTDATRPSWDSRRKVEWNGQSLCILTPAGLIALKTLRGSGQDLEDIAYLRRIDDEN